MPQNAVFKKQLPKFNLLLWILKYGFCAPYVILVRRCQRCNFHGRWSKHSNFNRQGVTSECFPINNTYAEFIVHYDYLCACYLTGGIVDGLIEIRLHQFTERDQVLEELGLLPLSWSFSHVREIGTRFWDIFAKNPCFNYASYFTLNLPRVE